MNRATAWVPGRPLLGPGAPKPWEGARAHFVPYAAPKRISAELVKFIARSQISRRRVELWVEQWGKCHWCSVDTWLRKPGDHKVYRRAVRDREATLDHLYSRLNPKRQTPPHGQRRYVMACSKCNFERGRDECAALGVDELRRRAGRFPQEQRA